MIGWNNLPIEMQEMIVRRSTKSCRNALKLCSSNSKQLVEWTKLNSVASLQISLPWYCNIQSWSIKVVKRSFSSYFNDVKTLRFGSCEELQKGLTNLLKTIDCIEELTIKGLGTEVLSNLSKEGTRNKLRVESIVISLKDGNGQTKKLLSQIEPVYLRKVQLCSDEGNSEIYDMPQIIFAEELTVFATTCIREDQLLKLHARKVNLKCPKCSLSEYVNKCTREADVKFPQFTFESFNSYFKLRRAFSWFSRKVLLKTSNANLKLELSFNFELQEVAGNVRFISEQTASAFSWFDRTVPKKIEKLHIRFSPIERCWVISMTRQTHAEYKYKFKSIAEATEKLDEVLEHIDYVQNFYLNLQKSDEELIWKTRPKKLQVSTLNLKAGPSTASISNFLKIVDASYVHMVEIELNHRDATLFEMPHIRFAPALKICGSVVRNDDLSRMGTECFVIKGFTPHNDNIESITSNGINQYLKKCFQTPNSERHLFEFHKIISSHSMNESELFEDLDILNRIVSGSWRTLQIGSGHSKYMMEVKVNIEEGSVLGQRKKKTCRSKESLLKCSYLQ